ncbi:hypothetical protein HMPREF0765_4165 [Sphingobacterium spiritivorum ATCC 33300]|uniref:Uncharacterized protein n=1 Tax=Sphingobacterium spiritivorum ATCC 33300 TaxID=525372 RepID=C2G3K9_SPHSI|nr:hypothetical protein [Sphingobacterium spiritivorum]EEI90214.1 hypothetical protein HMPREF0765_4165 [Sphingobacterium spiritivorum ATCC 33300]QQS95151.1 hypothetical protein I6J03_17475 [Sphingobacterium spiritivorum]
MARPETLRLHQDIRHEFERMSKIKAHGVQKFTYEYIFNEIAIKFYKSPKTIENIVFNRTSVSKMTTSKQTVLF